MRYDFPAEARCDRVARHQFGLIFQDLSGSGPESSAQKGPLLCSAVRFPDLLLAWCAGFLAFQDHANHLGNDISQASAEITRLEADLESAVNALSRAQQVRWVFSYS